MKCRSSTRTPLNVHNVLAELHQSTIKLLAWWSICDNGSTLQQSYSASLTSMINQDSLIYFPDVCFSSNCTYFLYSYCILYLFDGKMPDIFYEMTLKINEKKLSKLQLKNKKTFTYFEVDQKIRYLPQTQ